MNYRKQWEDYHGIKIPDGWQIHHITYQSNGGTDSINNLLAMPVKLHKKMHKYDDVSDAFIAAANNRKGHSPWSKGFTKHTHPSVASQSKIMSGRNKHNCLGKASQAKQMLGNSIAKTDDNKYWFEHKLYGLVLCTRAFLRGNFNKPKNIKELFRKNRCMQSYKGWKLKEVYHSVT